MAAAGLTPLAVAAEEPVPAGAGPLPRAVPDAAAAVAPQPLQEAPRLTLAASTSELKADFGKGKDIGPTSSLMVHVAVGAPTAGAPDFLDLSGAQFDLSDEHGKVVGSCTTSATGTCLVSVDDGSGDDGSGDDVGTVPAGTYEVTQVTAPLGLAVESGGLASVVLAETEARGAVLGVDDAPLFGHRLAVTLDEAGEPVTGAAYTLTGPSFDGSRESVRTWGPVTSDDDGVLGFGDGEEDWFAPGASYTLTQVDVPKGVPAEDPVPLDVRPAADDGPLTAVHHLPVPPAAPAPATSSSAAPPPPSTSPAAPSRTAPPRTSAPATTAAPAATPSEEATAAPRAQRRAATGGTAVATAAAGATTAPVTTEPAPSTTAAPLTASAPAPEAAGPTVAPLRTESSNLSEVPLVALGILFVVLVFFLVLLARRRARAGD